MFTGIIEEVGKVAQLQGSATGAILQIKAQKVLQGSTIGDSIAVNGVCLTIISIGADGFLIELSAETLRRTNLGESGAGDPLNLERSLSFGERMGGHFVQGHIDDCGTVVRVVPEGKGKVIRFQAPPAVLHYVVSKGYIAVDGMSLTVVEPDTQSFAVAFIPHTLANTVAQHYRPGIKVNLEGDVLGKYVEKFVIEQTRASTGGVTSAFLQETGFA